MASAMPANGAAAGGGAPAPPREEAEGERLEPYFAYWTERLSRLILDTLEQTGHTTLLAFYEAPAEIVPGLYLGNMAHAQNVAKLQELGISAVVNAARDPHAFYFSTSRDHYPSDFEYIEFQALDMEDYPIIPLHLEETLEFVRKVRGGPEKRKTLIHCQAGMNRSAALLVGVLLDQRPDIHLEHAVLLTASKRGTILSNEGFLRQLVEHAHKLGRLPTHGVPSDLLPASVRAAKAPSKASEAAGAVAGAGAGAPGASGAARP